MRFGTIGKIHEDSTVNIRFADGTELDAATLYGYQPIIFEQVVVADVDGEPVALGSVFNRASDLGDPE